MIPMEPGPEDFARQLAERRVRMQEARAIAYFAHSRTGLLVKYVRRLADRIDPTGRARQASDSPDERAQPLSHTPDSPDYPK